MIRALALAISTAGCHWVLGLDTYDHPPPIDAIDAPVDAPDAAPGFTCLGRDLVRNICAATSRFQPLQLASETIDTDQDSRCLPVTQSNNNPTLCVLIGTTITMSGTIRAHGTRPLGFASITTLTIAPGAVVDVSSAGTNVGAGTTGPGCIAVSTPAQPLNGLAAAGGAGGSLNGSGGDGGSSVDQNGMVGAYAAALGGPLPTGVRGGCPGNPGGIAGSVMAAPGGAPGGAVLLVAGGVLAIEGAVYAYGSGGGGGARGVSGDFAGGGGGGAGGMIALDGDTIAIGATARLVASGGGGGGGADGTIGPGTAGAQVDLGFPPARANGGPGAGTAGAGGFGSNSALDGLFGGTTSSQGGGGGGGGGAGHVRMSPAPTIVQGAIVVPTT